MRMSESSTTPCMEQKYHREQVLHGENHLHDQRVQQDGQDGDDKDGDGELREPQHDLPLQPRTPTGGFLTPSEGG